MTAVILRLRDHILALLLEAKEEGLSVQELHDQLEKQGTPAATGPLRGRLSELLQIGVVDQIGKARYTLTRSHEALGEPIEGLVEFLHSYLRPEEMARTVVWDATPYLALSEDGVQGRHVVVETRLATQLLEVLNSEYESRKGHGAWLVPRQHNRAGPLGGALTSEPRGHDPGMDIALVAEERIGGTAVNRRGFRTPFSERIMLEFLSMDAEIDVGRAIVEHQIRQGFDIRRAWQCAVALDILPEFTAFVTAVYPRLTRDQQDCFQVLVPGLVGSYIAELA